MVALMSPLVLVGVEEDRKEVVGLVSSGVMKITVTTMGVTRGEGVVTERTGGSEVEIEEADFRMRGHTMDNSDVAIIIEVEGGIK